MKQRAGSKASNDYSLLLENKPPYTDHTIVQRLVAGDQAAMTQVFQTYYPRLHYYSTELIGHAADAEDIVQEAFLNFWLNVRDKGVVPEHIKAYLFSMVRNRCLNYLERQRMLDERNGEVIERFHREMERQATEQSLREAIFHRLTHEMHRLTGIQADVMRVLFIEGLSVAEAAEQLQMTPNNIRNHKARAIERLKEMMQADIFLLFLFFSNFYEADVIKTVTELYSLV